MSRPTTPHLNLEPLAHIAAVRSDRPRHTLGCQCASTPDTCWSDHDLAELLHVDPRTIVRWRANGIPIGQADQLATRLHLLPQDIWDEWEPWADHQVLELEAAGLLDATPAERHRARHTNLKRARTAA